jgi:hypothetical protein
MTSTPLTAQTPLVSPGEFVRVSSPVYSGLATVVRAETDLLNLMMIGSVTPVRVPIASITHLERQRRATAFERMLRGAKWGSIIGGSAGVLFIPLLEKRRPEDPPKALWPLIGGVMWGGIGTLIGLSIPQHRWDRVPLPQRVGVSGEDEAMRIVVFFVF